MAPQTPPPGAGLLVVGLYYSYFRKPECAPSAECEVPNPALRRFHRTLLWLGAVAVVGLAFFPSYAWIFAGDEIAAQAELGTLPSKRVVLQVDGMTCAACAVSVQRELARVPGVLSADSAAMFRVVIFLD